MNWRQSRLYLLFTPTATVNDPWQTLRTALDAGVDLVQWRVDRPDSEGPDSEGPDSEGPNSEGLQRCLEICATRDVQVIVNDHLELATASQVAGLHIGQEDAAPATARAAMSETQCLGISTHDLVQARDAIAAGADYIGLGPCYPTRTKGYDAGLAVEVLRGVTAAAHVPVFAIGGITPERIAPLRELGLTRFAVSSSILAAGEPGRVVERFRDELDA